MVLRRERSVPLDPEVGLFTAVLADYNNIPPGKPATAEHFIAPGELILTDTTTACRAPTHERMENIVIIRVFRPTIHPGKEGEFESFLRDTAVPLVSQQAGLIAQHVGRSHDASSTEYLYVTVWKDVESIRAFAGEGWQEAVITPDEQHLLKNTWIEHYDVLTFGQ